MANTFNGIGTSFYGQRQFETDGSYVTTKWFVLGFFPVVPLGSLRVRHIGSGGIPFLSSSSTFEVVEELPLNGLQVLSTYLYAIFIVAWFGYLMSKDMSGIAKFLLIIAGVLLPHGLRLIAKMRAS